MKTPVHIQTKFGLDYYTFIKNEYDLNKQVGLLDFFSDLCSVEAERVSNEIDSFLDSDDAAVKHKMNDADDEGWLWFKGMNDKYSILNYYKNRK